MLTRNGQKHVIDDLLYTPSYGWKDKFGALIVPTSKQLWSEAFSRMNIFKSRRNWISFVSFLMLTAMLPFFALFIFKYFSWYLVIAIVLYSICRGKLRGREGGHRLSWVNKPRPLIQLDTRVAHHK